MNTEQNQSNPAVGWSNSNAGLGMPKNNSKRRRILKALNVKPKERRNRFVKFFHTAQLPDLL